MSGNFSVADGVLSVAGEMPEVAAVECSWKGVFARAAASDAPENGNVDMPCASQTCAPIAAGCAEETPLAPQAG